jgi:hypothetical protein
MSKLKKKGKYLSIILVNIRLSGDYTNITQQNKEYFQAGDKSFNKRNQKRIDINKNFTF